MHIYQPLVLGQHQVSAKTGLGLEDLKDILKNGVSLFAGHSGVGKSTLLNQLIPDLNQKTAEVSNFNKKGQHTTTTAELFAWPFGGYLVDTPGIKEFGLVEIEPEELKNYFKEFIDFQESCKFHNCQHINEPACAIKQAVETGQIPLSRYENYLIIREELSQV